MPKRLLYICVTFFVLKWNLAFTTAQENVALHKSADQSSTWNDSTGLWTAQNAVNGDKSCDTVDGRHYSATDVNTNPWWKVDLGRLYNISTIVVYGRTDKQDQLANFQLYLTRDNPVPESPYPSNPVYTASTYDNRGIFRITTSAVARYCLIRREGGTYTVVSLCEVEIFGTEIELIQRIKHNVITTISSNGSYSLTTTSWYSENAIDGQYSGNPNSCYCCSGTDGTEDPWWQIDLGDRYLVERVQIYGRTDGNSEQYSNLWIFVGDSSLVMRNGSLVYHGNATDGAYTYDLSLSPARLFRFLIIRQFQRGYMTICEVQLDESKCATNTFGNNCSQSCHCTNNESCYHADGTIFCDSCAQGWIGKNCSTQCPPNTFGNNCSLTCHCANNQSCFRTTGTISCDSCAPGFTGNTCSNSCAIGTYGDNCMSICTEHCLNGKSQCNAVTGHCDQGCLSGNTGPKCDTVCPFATYGAGCSQHCGHCQMNLSCHHVNGSCLNGCASGYQPHGLLCDTECTTQTYGQDCALSCSTHCYMGVEQCNKVTGECKLGCDGGYTGFNCTTPCISGKYGRNCNNSCGHCLSVDQCSPVNGNCSNGCQPGYKGDTCKTECKDGKFGNDCSNFCHCQNDVACDKKTGSCSNGCDIMWTGDTCSEYKGFDLSHLKNATTQIDTFIYNSADRAVDRVNNDSIDTCQCCSVAENKRNVPEAWWQIDLRQKYLIDAVALFGRSDNTNQRQIQGAAVYAGNQSLSDNFSWGTLVYTVPSSIGDKYHFTHQLNSSIIARFFIVRINQTMLSLCEFQLRKKVCTVGSFGENCSQECHCKDGVQCDQVTGYCPNKECEPGWKGDSCNIKCENQKFGYGCNNTCHCSSCEPVNGTCHTQCDFGWRGSLCNQDANLISSINGDALTSMSSVYNDTWESYLAIDGNIGPDPSMCKCCARTNNAAMSWWSIDLGQKYPISSFTIFGRNEVPDIGQQLEGFQILLSNTSLFDQTISFMDNSSHVSSAYTVEVHNQLARFIKVQRPGVLTICEVSIQEGECPTGFFGTECSRTCKCLDNKPCSRSSGVCSTPFCQLGYRGIACDSECLPGTFGENCQEHCFCANGEICTSDHGLCPGRCDLGYYGPQCNKEITFDHTTQKQNSSAAASQEIQISLVIGISVGSFILVASVTSLIIFKIYRRHTHKRDKDNNTYMQSDCNIATNDADYDTLEVPQSEYMNNRYVNEQTSAL